MREGEGREGGRVKADSEGGRREIVREGGREEGTEEVREGERK